MPDLSPEAVLLWYAAYAAGSDASPSPRAHPPWPIACGRAFYPRGSLWELIEAGLVTWRAGRYRLTGETPPCAS